MSNDTQVKQEAPERIWINNPAEITEHDQNWWYVNPMAFPTVEYVRADLLATVRREVWNAAIKIAKAEAFERRMAYCVVEALEASANQKGEMNGCS